MSASKNEATSSTLMGRIQSGEKAAWDRLMWLYSPMVRFWCKRWGVAEADLDDVTQEVWLSLGPTLGGYRTADGRSFRGWLRGVTRHKTQDWHRRRSRQLAEAEGGSVAIRCLEQIKSDPGEDDPADAEQKAESQALYRRALHLVKAEFEERTWQAFLGATFEAKSAADVGAELGMTSAAVRMAKSRVLNRLRQELGEFIA